jgi:putative pyruvate formate lyase activating enzyme
MANSGKNISYPFLHQSGELHERVVAAQRLLTGCTLCPHRCGVNRTTGEAGFCGVITLARVPSFGPHFGEEPPLVGRTGSGAIFFAGCNLGCVFCQNHEISRIEVPGDQAPDTVTPEGLAAIMLELQEQGCLNINLVTPTHVVPQILEALEYAIPMGLNLPLVYNSGGYESVETLRLLEGIVDIYMPDCKFMSSQLSARYTGSSDYPEVMQMALREMHRQVGDLLLDENGIAVRGLLVRHLVMPGCLEDTGKIVRFLASEISPKTYVNIMDQYTPYYRAEEFSEINRPLSVAEFNQAMSLARKAGLHRFAEKEMARILESLFKARG